MTPSNPLQQLHGLDRASPQFHQHLGDFLRDNEYRNTVSNLQGEDLAWLVEYLDSILVGISGPASAAFQESLRGFREVCGIKGVLPKSCMLRVKRVRMHSNGDPQKVKETFHRVAAVWKHLAHPNLVPLLGVTADPPQFVLGWVSGGDLTGYITNHPDADRLGLLSDVAEGLNYLHSCDVTHGGLKGSNVLVDTTGRARITDFGLAMVTQNTDSVRWIAPEILDDRGAYSKEADVFSFAMVTIEAFTGAVPFSDKPSRAAMVAIVCGERPPRPIHPTLTDELWALTQRCWDQKPYLRPQLLQILCGFGIPAWKRLISHPLTTEERISLITAIFSDRDEIEVVKGLRGENAQSFVDVIYEALDTLTPSLRRKCLSVLCKICGRQAFLPKSVQILFRYNRSDASMYHGGYADVWKGEHQGRQVAVKVLRVSSTSDLDKITRRFCKEVVMWKILQHPNVLPLLGATMCNRQFAMVSEWMANGNIVEFIKSHGDANRFELLEDVAQGLVYLHGQAMIHGDLKGANILIDQSGRARLADFGLLTIISGSAYPTSSGSSTDAGTVRWMSPELIDPDRFGLKNRRPTNESDCYALGMVILEVLSGQVPFPSDFYLVVIRKVIESQHPRRPQGAKGVWFTDDLWEMLELCWSPQPKNRPTIEAVLECLKRVSATGQPQFPNAYGEVGTDTDDEPYSTPSDPSMFPHLVSNPTLTFKEKLQGPQHHFPSVIGYSPNYKSTHTETFWHVDCGKCGCK